MIKNNKIKKITSMLLLSGMLVTAPTSVQASDSTSSSENIDYELLADAVSERTYLDEELNKIGLSVDKIFELPKMDEQFYNETTALTQDIWEDSSSYELEPTVQTLEAQRLAYAGKMARWSKSKNPTVNEQQEVIYMYLSHYVDVPRPLAASNGISNNSTGLLAQYIRNRDREAYDLYLSRGSGIQAAKNIKNLISFGASAPGDVKDSINWLRGEKRKVELIGHGGEIILDAIDGVQAFNSIQESMQAGKSPEDIIDSVRERLQPKYGEMSEEIAKGFSEIVFSIAAGNLTPQGAIITATGIAFDLSMNIYDTLTFIGMRIDFSARYSGRFDYYMTGKY